MADVIGPADPVPRLAESVFVSQEARASRFVVVFDTPPTEHGAIQDWARPEDALPGMVREPARPRRPGRASPATPPIASASVDAMQDRAARASGSPRWW